MSGLGPETRVADPTQKEVSSRSAPRPSAGPGRRNRAGDVAKGSGFGPAAESSSGLG